LAFSNPTPLKSYIELDPPEGIVVDPEQFDMLPFESKLVEVKICVGSRHESFAPLCVRSAGDEVLRIPVRKIWLPRALPEVEAVRLGVGSQRRLFAVNSSDESVQVTMMRPGGPVVTVPRRNCRSLRGPLPDALSSGGICVRSSFSAPLEFRFVDVTRESAVWFPRTVAQGESRLIDLGVIRGFSRVRLPVCWLGPGRESIRECSDITNNSALDLRVLKHDATAERPAEIEFTLRPSALASGIVHGAWRFRFEEQSPMRILLARAFLEPDPDAEDVAPLTIVVGGGESGRLQPCNCSAEMSGGIARAASVVEDLGRHNDVLFLHAGDAVGIDTLTQSAKLRFVLKSLARMNCAAMCPGEQELSLPPQELLDESSSSGVSLVCANLHYGDNERTFVRPFIPVRVGKIKGIVVGLVDAAILGSPKVVENGYDIKHPVMALERVLDGLKIPADFVIVLGHLRAATIRGLASRVEEAGLICAAHSGPCAPRLGLTSVLCAPPGGHGLSILRASVSVGGLQERRRYWEQLRHQVQPDAGITHFYREYNEACRDLELEPLASPREFIGSESCKECHLAAWKKWKGQPHSHALATLVKKGSEFDPDCLPCHTVAFNRGSGYRSAQRTPELADVGCEACHGPGAAHVRTQSKLPSPVACISCHEPSRSPGFQRSEAWKNIEHR
jgi:hypothetical protein